MGLFNMLESVFFITLGISCVLLMMLIYHFKQRISKLESNNETMFEIINNMVQELSAIKTTIQPHVMPPQFSYPNNQYDKIDVNIDEDMPLPMLKQSTTIEDIALFSKNTQYIFIDSSYTDKELKKRVGWGHLSYQQVN